MLAGLAAVTGTSATGPVRAIEASPSHRRAIPSQGPAGKSASHEKLEHSKRAPHWPGQSPDQTPKRPSTCTTERSFCARPATTPDPAGAPNGGSRAAGQRSPWRSAIVAGLRYASASAQQGSRRSSPLRPGTGTLAADELGDHQPHVDDYIAQAQLKTCGLKRDPPTRNPGPSSSCPWCNHARRKGIPQAPGGWHPLPEGKPDRRGSR